MLFSGASRSSAAGRRSLVALAALALLALGPATAEAGPYERWYLAEGATGPFFDEDILIANPNTKTAQIRITFLKPDGSTVVQTLAVPATSRATIRADEVPGLEATAVSAVVECTNGLDVLVERAMTWPNGEQLSGHHAAGVTAPATRWYLAEGATGFFDQFILIANPSDAQAEVSVRYVTDTGQSVVQPYTIKADSRLTVWVNDMVPGLAAAAFGTIVESTNDVPVLVERAMYWGKGFQGGHDSPGVTEPSTEWLFAEGFTGGTPAFGFDTYLLLANPGEDAASTKVTFFRDAGGPIVEHYALAPGKRLTIAADQIAGLEAAAFSARVESTNGTPIIAERSVYWGSGGWREGHNTPGATSPALRWGFADGSAVGPTDTYVLVMNSEASWLHLKATFLREDGTGIVRTFDVAPESRFTIAPGQFIELMGRRFSTFLESTTGLPFVAEQAVYWGQPFAGGYAGGGTAWPSPIATPAAPPATTWFSTATNQETLISNAVPVPPELVAQFGTREDRLTPAVAGYLARRNAWPAGPRAACVIGLNNLRARYPELRLHNSHGAMATPTEQTIHLPAALFRGWCDPWLTDAERIELDTEFKAAVDALYGPGPIGMEGKLLGNLQTATNRFIESAHPLLLLAHTSDPRIPQYFRRRLLTEIEQRYGGRRAGWTEGPHYMQDGWIAMFWAYLLAAPDIATTHPFFVDMPRLLTDMGRPGTTEMEPWGDVPAEPHTWRWHCNALGTARQFLPGNAGRLAQGLFEAADCTTKKPFDDPWNAGFLFTSLRPAPAPLDPAANADAVAEFGQGLIAMRSGSGDLVTFWAKTRDTHGHDTPMNGHFSVFANGGPRVLYTIGDKNGERRYDGGTLLGSNGMAFWTGGHQYPIGTGPNAPLVPPSYHFDIPGSYTLDERDGAVVIVYDGSPGWQGVASWTRTFVWLPAERAVVMRDTFATGAVPIWRANVSGTPWLSGGPMAVIRMNTTVHASAGHFEWRQGRESAAGGGQHPFRFFAPDPAIDLPYGGGRIENRGMPSGTMHVIDLPGFQTVTFGPTSATVAGTTVDFAGGVTITR